MLQQLVLKLIQLSRLNYGRFLMSASAAVGLSAEKVAEVRAGLLKFLCTLGPKTAL